MRSPLLSTDEPEREAPLFRTHKCRRLWPLGSVLTLLSVALLITAAVKPSVYKSTVELTVGQVTFDVGAFQVRVQLDALRLYRQLRASIAGQ